MLRATLIAALVVVAAAAAEEPPETKEVLLKQGLVKGVRESIGDSRFFYSFRGIPYATAPVGELRFKEPTPVVEWVGVRKGFSPPACPQISMASFLGNKMDISGEEDCLYLHVYAPKTDAADLPVMVYIHGGGFLLGDADNLGGTPRPLLKKNIILVSIQYRLGTLGFLSTGDSVLPGNLGMKDQTFALQWVQDNIRDFGGDPHRVTIFGESAGSASSHYHTLTPYSKGLFHRAILQSGTTLSPWAVRDDHAQRAMAGAKSFSCPTADDPSPDSSRLLQCFKEQSLEDLVLLAMKGTVMNLPFMMVPRVDGDYLPAHPALLLKQGKYHKVDIISGVCQNELASTVIMFGGNETVRSGLIEGFDHMGPYITGMDAEDNNAYLALRGMYHYAGDVSITEENIHSVEKFLSDSMMNRGHDEATILHARDAEYGRHTYRYELQHRGENSLSSLYNYTIEAAKDWVSHADDLKYMFDVVLGQPQVNRSDDVFLSNIIVDLWTNFAITGNPTPDMELGFKWEAMKSKDDLRYLSLIPSPRMKDDNRAENREFWRNMPLKINKVLFPDRFA